MVEAIKKLCFNSAFQKITERTERFNIFRMMKIHRKELVHSDILAALLNPNYPHGLSNLFLNNFLQSICNIFDPALIIKLIKSNVIIYRERFNIDVILDFPEDRKVIAIENKIDAYERENQIRDYQKRLLGSYKNYTHYLVFLTPLGREPYTAEKRSEVKIITMSYKDIIEITRNICQTASPNVKYFLNEFIKHIEEDIMGQNEVLELCKDIYYKHPDAYKSMVDNYNIIRNRIIIQLFTDLKREIEDWAKNMNLDLAIPVIKETPKRGEKIKIYWDINNIRWPNDFKIRIYKDYYFGIFPVLITSSLNGILKSTLKNIFSCEPEGTQDFEDSCFYFTKEFCESENPSPMRAINVNGDDITSNDVEIAFKRFKEIFYDINTNLLKI